MNTKPTMVSTTETQKTQKNRKSAVHDAAAVIRNILTADGPQPHLYVAQFLIHRFADPTIAAAAEQVGVLRWTDAEDRIWWSLPEWSPTEVEQPQIGEIYEQHK